MAALVAEEIARRRLMALAWTAAVVVIAGGLFLIAWAVLHSRDGLTDSLFGSLSIFSSIIALGALVIVTAQRAQPPTTMKQSWPLIVGSLAAAAAVVYSVWFVTQSTFFPLRFALQSLLNLVPYAVLLILGGRWSIRPIGSPSIGGQVVGLVTLAGAAIIGLLAASDIDRDQVWTFLGAANRPAALAIILLAASRGAPGENPLDFREAWALPAASVIILCSVALTVWQLDRYPVGLSPDIVVVRFLSEIVGAGQLALLLLAVCGRVSLCADWLASLLLLAGAVVYAWRLANLAESSYGDGWIFLSAIAAPFGLMALCLVALEVQRIRRLAVVAY